jgi:putative transposase
LKETDDAQSRFSEQQIIGILKEHQAGFSAKGLCRKHGILDATFYSWRSKYGGMEVSKARRLRALEEENRKLKKLLAASMPDNSISGIRVARQLISPILWPAKRIRGNMR